MEGGSCVIRQVRMVWMIKRAALRILIVGLGSIGRRHARIIQKRMGCEVAVLRSQGRGNDMALKEYYS